ncbi:MAG: lipid II flippase MurJ [Candidatus Krumholzibacteria bacterium]|nr:lipid II flippase MurJ [Candidatus Krumholzibacteria bacterium]
MERLDLRRLLFDREVMGLMGLTLLVKPIGLLNQVLIARWFGAGEELDAYALAYFLVTFGDGTISHVFKGAMAPYLIQLKRAYDRLTFARFQNGVLALFMGSGALWLLGLVLAAGAVVSVVGPELPPVSRDLTVRMMVLLALPAFVLVANNLGIAVLNLHQFFRLAGAMPLLNSLAMLAALLLWHDKLGIWALPAGFALSQVLQWPLIHLRAWRVRVLAAARPTLARRDLRRVGDLIGLVLLAQVLLMVNAFLDKWFATGLEAGSISSLTYAMTLTNFGLLLFASSLMTVMYPRMSEAITAGDLTGCSDYIRQNLARLAHLVVPASLALALAGPEIVRVLFQRGAFDAADALRTSGTTTMYLLGLPALIINTLVARIFHSLQLLRDKVWLAVQYLATNALLNFLLIGPLQVRGLALASTLAINLHLLLSLWILHRRRSGLATAPLLAIVGRSYLLAIGAALIYWLLPLGSSLLSLNAQGFIGTLTSAIVKCGVILLAYGGLLFLLRRYRR